MGILRNRIGRRNAHDCYKNANLRDYVNAQLGSYFDFRTLHNMAHIEALKKMLEARYLMSGELPQALKAVNELMGRYTWKSRC